MIKRFSINGNAYEGRTVNFWDDVVDTAETKDSDNSYFIINRSDNGGVLRWPLVIMSGRKTVKINRLGSGGGILV